MRIIVWRQSFVERNWKSRSTMINNVIGSDAMTSNKYLAILEYLQRWEAS